MTTAFPSYLPPSIVYPFEQIMTVFDETQERCYRRIRENYPFLIDALSISFYYSSGWMLSTISTDISNLKKKEIENICCVAIFILFNCYFLRKLIVALAPLLKNPEDVNFDIYRE